MPKQRCLDCGKICYGWSPGPCPYCQSFNLEHLSGPSPEEVPSPKTSDGETRALPGSGAMGSYRLSGQTPR